MSVTRRDDPLLGFTFHVEIDSLTVAGFSSVTGIEQQMEPEEYEEGGRNDRTHRLPTRYTQPNLELQHGFTESRDLWDWFEKAQNGTVERKDVWVYLLDSLGARPWGWKFTRAYPVRWAGPEFQADQNAVAVETLELAHDGFTVISRGQGGGAPRS